MPLQVDFGGMLGEHSWLGPIGAALGLTERLTERMLTAVMLIKDEVEQQRFKVCWVDKRRQAGGVEDGMRAVKLLALGTHAKCLDSVCEHGVLLATMCIASADCAHCHAFCSHAR